MDKNTISHDPFIDLISNGVKYLVKCWVYNYYHMFLRLLTMQLSKEIRIENCPSCFVTNPNSCQILSASILLLMQWTVHWSKTEVKSRQCNSYKTAIHRWWHSSQTSLFLPCMATTILSYANISFANFVIRDAMSTLLAGLPCALHLGLPFSNSW